MATVYRNLQEQVYENAKDIDELHVEINTKIDDIRKIHSDDKQNAYVEFSNDSAWYSTTTNIPHIRIHQKEGSESSLNLNNDIKLDNGGVDIFSSGPRNNGHIKLSAGKTDLHLYDSYASLVTTNNHNLDNTPKTRGLEYLGEYLEYVRYKDSKDLGFDTYKYTLPLKSGTLALVEDIPANTGYIKAHTIENDAEKNYTTKIDLGSGNSGSTLHLEAPGDNGIGSIDIANEYVQGSTAIKFTADKLVFGNTEITEQQLQKLLALIQNQ